MIAGGEKGEYFTRIFDILVHQLKSNYLTSSSTLKFDLKSIILTKIKFY